MVKVLEHEDVQPVGDVESSAEIVEAVAEHMEAFFGEANFVVREKTSQHVQLDVHVIERAHDMGARLEGSILFTTGMSAKPMFGVPEEFRSAAEHAELMMAVAQPWNARDALDWPYRWLRFLGRFPFSYRTNLMASQTIDLRKAFPDDPSGFCGAYFRYWKRRKDVGFLSHGDGFSTSILSVVPIYEPELLLHQSRGAAALEQAFYEAQVDIDWIRSGRPSVC